MTLSSQPVLKHEKTKFAWNQLCQHKLPGTLSPRELHDLDSVKNKPHNWVLAIARLALRMSQSEHTYAKFLNCSWADIVDIVYDQAVRNRLIRSENWYEQAVTAGNSRHLDRAHNQLPCTLHSSQKRVQQALRICHLDDPILVIGDDDLVGIELAKAGFLDVSSVDIDPEVCAQLNREKENLGLRLNVLEHDIKTSPPESFKRSYRLIFMDPMYSLQGLDLFLQAAFSFSKGESETYFFLSIHLMSLLRKDLEEFPSFLSERNLETVEFFPGFNTYPVPRSIGLLIKLFNRSLLNTSLLASFSYMFKFFFSDAILLKAGDPPC